MCVFFFQLHPFVSTFWTDRVLCHWEISSSSLVLTPPLLYSRITTNDRLRTSATIIAVYLPHSHWNDVCSDFFFFFLLLLYKTFFNKDQLHLCLIHFTLTTKRRQIDPFGSIQPAVMTDNIQNSMEAMSLHRQQSSYSQSPSLRSSNAYLPGSDPQSASARFERFFNNPSNASPTLADQQSSSPNFQHQSASSLGPSSSAAGLASNGVFGSFGHSFGAGGGSGAFNHGTSNNQTVPALRTKSSNLRQGIPSQWSTATNDEVVLNGISPAGGQNNSSNQYFSSGTDSTYFGQGNGPTTNSIPADDDIIPTAIVVKNIPFSIKKEQLLQIIEDLRIPMPYAFNYHFDQGVFRGLAFANFRSGEEADAVVAALNGFDVSGRKLRVEYKKVLQAGEKERIEKEKAIKRMQSMQMEKERERMRRQTVSSGSTFTLPPRPAAESDSVYVDYNEPAAAVPAVTPYLPAADSQIDDTEVGGASDAGGRKEGKSLYHHRDRANLSSCC